MFNFFKRKEVSFICSQEAFINAWPPVYSKDIQRPFLKKCKEEYQQHQIRQEKNVSCPFQKHRNTAKCDGIRDMISCGYLIRLHRDIRISTTGDGTSYISELLPTPVDDNNMVSHFKKYQYSDFINTPENALKTVLKINTPWMIGSTDYCFIQTHPSFFGEHRFTVIEGVIDPLKSRQINVIMFWNVLEGTEILRAGTPISQLIPIHRKFLPKLKIESDKNNLTREVYNREVLKNSTNNHITF
jgi:hypothetical protein